MKIVSTTGTVTYLDGDAGRVTINDDAENHPWVPGATFQANPELLPMLRALEESGIETAEELRLRLLAVPLINLDAAAVRSEMEDAPSGTYEDEDILYICGLDDETINDAIMSTVTDHFWAAFDVARQDAISHLMGLAEQERRALLDHTRAKNGADGYG